MLSIMGINAVVMQFKFQYGATNIKMLVLLKSRPYTFKFQYGATNIVYRITDYSHPFEFKFQYGATNIGSQGISVL